MKAYVLLMNGKKIVSCLWVPKPRAASMDELFASTMTQMNDPFYSGYFADWDTLVVKIASGLGVDGPVKRGPRT